MLYVESTCLKGVHFEDIAREIGYHKTTDRVHYIFYRGWGEPPTLYGGGYDLSSLDGGSKLVEKAAAAAAEKGPKADLGGEGQDEWVKKWAQKAKGSAGSNSDDSDSDSNDDEPTKEPTEKHVAILKVGLGPPSEILSCWVLTLWMFQRHQYLPRYVLYVVTSIMNEKMLYVNSSIYNSWHIAGRIKLNYDGTHSSYTTHRPHPVLLTSLMLSTARVLPRRSLGIT